MQNNSISTAESLHQTVYNRNEAFCWSMHKKTVSDFSDVVSCGFAGERFCSCNHLLTELPQPLRCGQVGRLRWWWTLETVVEVTSTGRCEVAGCGTVDARGCCLLLLTSAQYSSFQSIHVYVLRSTMFLLMAGKTASAPAFFVGGGLIPKPSPLFLQCFDTVGWVIWPVKTRPRYDL